MLLAVLASGNVRLNRVKHRGRADDSVQHFNERDRREIEYGVAVCIALADACVLKDCAMDDHCGNSMASSKIFKDRNQHARRLSTSLRILCRASADDASNRSTMTG